MRLDAGLWGPWMNRPDRCGVLLDFDGTLAAIVERPELARPLPGAGDALRALAERYRLVAVVSGRPVAFLAEHLPVEGVQLSGLYGLEAWQDGAVSVDPRAERWRSVVGEVAERAEHELPDDVGVERKGLSVTLHTRTAVESDAIVTAWAEAQAARTGLALHPARRSYELRPPLPCDKGTVVTELARGLDALCFAGDDLGDVPAFEALVALHAARPDVSVVRVAVVSDESPPGLLDAADTTVTGPDEALELLRALGNPVAEG
jgi:trehalose 6-phosphate phosphatase